MTTPKFALRRIIPITQMRRDLFAISTAVKTKGVRYIITENGYPKMAMVPVEDIERLVGGASVVADAAMYGYGGGAPRHGALFVGDADGPARQRRYATRELTRAHLSVSLIEKYGYGLERLTIGHYVQISDSRYIEADLIVHDGDGRVQMAFMVVPAHVFDERVDAAIDDLYQLLHTFITQGQQDIRWLVCYAYDFDHSATRRERILAINCHRYPTKATWDAAGRPTEGKVPLAGARVA